MPIVPYLQHGGQVPLRGLLPSSIPTPSISLVDIPEYPEVAIHTSQTPDETRGAALDASYKHIVPTIDIPTSYSSHKQASGQAPTFVPGAATPSNVPDTQMKGRKPAIAAAGTFLGLFSFSQIYQNVLFTKLTPSDERADDIAWVASSHSWLDRKACDWFGLCGLAHLNRAGWTTKSETQKQHATDTDTRNSDKIDLTDFWNDARNLPDDWEAQEEREIPDYVLKHAPLIHLYSGEDYWPGDIAEHLIHTTPHLNYTALQAAQDHPNLTDLGELNRWGRFVYLQSDDNVEDRPEWLGGKVNIPNVPKDGNDDDDDRAEHDAVHGHYEEDKDGENSGWWHVGPGDTKDKGGIRPVLTSPGLPVPTATPEGDELVNDDDPYWQPELRNRHRRLAGKKVVGGRSDAPAVLIVVPKGDGVVDAFWFFFYSYNLGNAVFNIRFGNHVGDWEHTVVRFKDCEPKAVFFSEHSFGEAYTWDAVEKSGKRPIGFSATGTHAMYATPGVHPYVLPGGILHDVTDRGPLWDPVQNMYSFTYHYQSDTLLSSNLHPTAPVSWFYFAGHWGDKFYPLSDARQYRFLGQYHYVNGPLGPRFKNLGRQEICQGNGECVLKRWIGDKTKRIKRWESVGEGEEMSEDDARRVWGAEYDSAS
ncbi:vacuolar sorting-associated protein-like protein [Cucurbitaria berberidis CBS 394.84]|uniref:Vacuolar sorting-associated protein-like protein n=1 Tax=Cucurbitaria berberidis CBS 394.84 TaxID=1168544 RepID=A0A9P4G747_9PLEO|nr:vacuolar sorting-associated protein-like protein [Cucurbitaria berberidis CBS 394.84]KAF1840268.1 vacuolar sorting-associated protein-like protein [Cucurbitaria berberidis CBS 394.84]